MSTHKAKCLSIKKLSYWYDSARILFKNLTFTIHEQDMIVILGPNGTGKSTLIQLILGLKKPKTGKIFWHGVLQKRARMSYLPQQQNLDHHFPITTEELIIMGLIGEETWKRRATSRQKTLLSRALTLFDVAKYAHKRISTLSGGQLQKALIARAAINHPKVLFLDEPNQYLDQKANQELFHYLQEWNKETAIIIVTHDAHLVKNLPKPRTLLLNKTILEYTQHR